MNDSPTLLATYVTALERQNVPAETIALLKPMAAAWIEVLRQNPNRLTGSEITLVTIEEISTIFVNHFDILWMMVIDPDQGFGRMGRNKHPFLIE